tara:strand:+ start:2498 stop:3025 length:528 start_codon:yes stop_codon:yes gene_type:complete
MEQFFQYLDTIARPYPLQYAVDLYNEVLKHKPKVCYELGSSWGFTTCAIAKALDDINEGGKLYSYEIDPRRVAECKKNLSNLNLESVCSIETKDIFDENFLGFTCNFLYIDIHNNGNKIQSVIDKMNDVDLIYFEGGSSIRNQVCRDRNVSTFENLSYDVIYGHDQKHSFSKLKR